MCTHGGSRYGNDGCRRTYLSQRDLRAHINHRHVSAPIVAEIVGPKVLVVDVKPNVPVTRKVRFFVVFSFIFSFFRLFDLIRCCFIDF